MACVPYTPVDAVNTILLCVQDILEAQPRGVPEQIIIGSDDAESGFNCCDNGILVITVRDANLLQERRTTSGDTSGCGGSYGVEVQIKTTRCISVYTPGPGGVAQNLHPDALTRSNDSMANLVEAWAVLEQLRCCGDAQFRNCTSYAVKKLRLLPQSGSCIGWEITVTLELAACCSRPIPGGE